MNCVVTSLSIFHYVWSDVRGGGVKSQLLRIVGRKILVPPPDIPAECEYCSIQRPPVTCLHHLVFGTTGQTLLHNLPVLKGTVRPKIT